MSKWNWNEPVTWKQSVILGIAGWVISVIYVITFFYGNEVLEKINDVWHWVRNLKRKW